MKFKSVTCILQRLLLFLALMNAMKQTLFGIFDVGLSRLIAFEKGVKVKIK